MPAPAAAGGLRGDLSAAGFDAYGFVETRFGSRVTNDDTQRTLSLAEARVQLEGRHDPGWGSFVVRGDLLADGVTDEVFFDLREASLLLFPASFVDLKLGRQVLTWGTGDLLFINDLFPKDWKSFFIGRDTEYLKAPSTAVKASFFHDLANLDVVYVPLFEPSEYIDGERLSYWNPILGRTAGAGDRMRDHDLDHCFRDDEWALRLYRNLGGVELALYGYHGFWSTPEGMDPFSGRLTFPELSTVGASARGALLGGLANVEIGYYDSGDDRDGDNPLIRNSEWRLLGGFEREIARDFTAGLQYYVEWLQGYGAYRRTMPAGMKPRDEVRHVLTLRLTRLLLNQNLTISCFTYWSPSDEDAYLRPQASYKLTDRWLLEAGANLFFGADQDTFFGQFEDNANVWAGIRWSY
ncbi:MAG: hypothetical protein JW781_10905 [Deltaproteobacteria bacterium]|nr:hypothetical protein [Candidatus Anaeroferrophillacea bacterium]